MNPFLLYGIQRSPTMSDFKSLSIESKQGMPRLPMHSLYFYLIFFSVFRNTVCISFHCHMDMDHSDIPLLSHGALESLPQNHLY